MRSEFTEKVGLDPHNFIYKSKDMVIIMEVIEVDKGHDELIYIPVCVYCKHGYLKEFKTCAAFPDGIPDEIWIGKNYNKKPYPGDSGIRFKPYNSYKIKD